MSITIIFPSKKKEYHESQKMRNKDLLDKLWELVTK